MRALAGDAIGGPLCNVCSLVLWTPILPRTLSPGPGPRSKIVIGNSTNACSWHASDPRHHANADPARDGSDLPAGFYLGASGSALACGFAIKEYDGDHHWKLIKGYGGGTSKYLILFRFVPLCSAFPLLSCVHIVIHHLS